MKPILKNREDSIPVNHISSEHIIIGLDNYKKPIILTNSEYNDNEFAFTCIDNEFTNRNSYEKFDSIEEAIEYSINNKGYIIEVFEQKDWKKALQWLIDNAE